MTKLFVETQKDKLEFLPCVPVDSIDEPEGDTTVLFTLEDDTTTTDLYEYLEEVYENFVRRAYECNHNIVDTITIVHHNSV